jgi:two-component system sensor histidine kinase PilS (NtrC family)
VKDDARGQSDLGMRLKRLMFFRVIMVTTLLLVATYVEAISESLAPVNPLYFIIAATYVLTVLHGIWLRGGRALVAQVYAQVAGDLLVITALVYISGGIRTGFMLLYPLSVLAGSVLVRRNGGVVLAGLATLLYGLALMLVRLRLLPPQGLAEAVDLPTRTIIYSVFVTAVACGSVALIGSYLGENLRYAGERLELMTGQVANLQGINDVIVNSIQSGLLTEDAEGRIQSINAIGEAIIGRTAASARGKYTSEVFGSSLLELSAVRARAASRSLARLEVPYRRPDGVEIDLGLSVGPLAGAAGPAGHLLVFQDLTDIKRLEEEMRIKEKLAAVGEMAAQLAHEIRNPLGSISGSAQVLLGESNFSAEQQRLLAIITRESKRLSDTLNRFLLQARTPSRPHGPVDIKPVIAGAVDLLRNGPEVSARHQVEFEVAEGPQVCLADPDQIAQVFWNLARNGLEAMPDGGSLRIRLFPDDREVVLSVHDEGRGMGREEQRRMFEPFQTRSAMGTGLGLAIVYNIVREHRGDITVRSRPGHGTRVEVRLPLVVTPDYADVAGIAGPSRRG